MFFVTLFYRLEARFNRSLNRQSVAHLDRRLLNDVGLTPDGYQVIPQEKNTPNNLVIQTTEQLEKSTSTGRMSVAKKC